MPDIEIAFTVPSELLSTAVAYLLVGVVAYLPLLVWTNTLVAQANPLRPRRALHGFGVTRILATTLTWPIVTTYLIRESAKYRRRVNRRRDAFINKEPRHG